MPNPDGDHIWYELLTTDPGAAADFYTKVVGWKVRDSGMAGMDYRLLSAPDADVGGMMKTPAGAPMPPSWLGYVGVADVDGKAAEVERLGGAIHMPPTDIPNIGRFAFVADPQGAVFYIMRGDSPQESTAFKPMTDGHCAWNELVTSDQTAAFDFYGKLFGWQKGDALPMGPMGDYTFIMRRGEMIGAIMNRQDSGQRPLWNYYFRVSGIDAAADRIKAGGGKITFGPMEVPGGDWVVNAIDPQGASLGLVGSKT
jgi:predicted enzyme related to lactoylglutathione lyase